MSGRPFLRPHAAPPSQGFRAKTLRGAPAPPPGPPGAAVAPAAAPARRRCAGAEARNLSAQFPGPAGPCSPPCASPAGRLQLPGVRRSCAGSQLTRLSSGPAQLGLGAMYAVYKQAHPPTGLEFSMYCNFFSNSERNLVVAGTSQLYVYRLNRDAEVGPGRAGVQPPPSGLSLRAGVGAQVQAERQRQTSPVGPPKPALLTALVSSCWAWRPVRRISLAFFFFFQQMV